MIVFATVDLLFFYFTIYISFRYDLCQHLISYAGDFKSEYNTDKRQSDLLKHVFIIHADILRCIF